MQCSVGWNHAGPKFPRRSKDSHQQISEAYISAVCQWFPVRPQKAASWRCHHPRPRQRPPPSAPGQRCLPRPRKVDSLWRCHTDPCAPGPQPQGCLVWTSCPLLTARRQKSALPIGNPDGSRKRWSKYRNKNRTVHVTEEGPEKRKSDFRYQSSQIWGWKDT